MQPIVLFDGDCHFCDWSVQLIIKHDRKGIYHFASLQSELAKKLMEELGIDSQINSLVLIENDRVFIKSAAVLYICKELSSIRMFYYILKVIPKSTADLCYDIFAKNRYRWFGKKNKCRIYPEHIRKRFL